MPRIKLFCNTGFAGCSHVDYLEIDDAEWAALTEDEKEKRLNEEASDFAHNKIEYGAYLAEDD